MHPLWKDKRALAVYVFSWAVIGVLLSAVAVAQGTFTWTEALVALVVPTVVCGLMCLASWYLCKAFPLEETGYMRVLPLFLVASAITSALWVIGANGWVLLVDLSGTEVALQDRFRGGTPLLFGIGNIFFFLAATTHYLIIATQKARETEQRALQLDLLARDAELKALRSQVDPHFLFNSLNSVSALTSTDPAGARDMVVRLAEFLRMILHSGGHTNITVDEELRLVGHFLDIERVRFGVRLQRELDTDAAAGSCAIPPLLLQPLVENAVNHGIAHLVEGGTIRILTRRSSERLTLKVENPTDEDRPRRIGSGVGLENVRRRLQVLYGTEARVNVTDEGRRFVVELELPAREVH